MSIEERIRQLGLLDTAVENVGDLPEEEYALVRKNTFGGSDASILCGVNLYKDMGQLLTEKKSKFVTEEEKAVGKKPAVMKGRDLEPLILSKASKELGKEIFKPKDMFKFSTYKGMTLNYDGIIEDEENNLIPVEAKFVTKWGEKYYNKAITRKAAMAVNMNHEGETLETHIKRKALMFGIPGYYYTQVQQEMMGTGATYGYLAALFEETWDFRLFYIKQDEYVQMMIAKKAEDHADEIL